MWRSALALVNREREYLIAALAILSVVVLLWAPFGMKTTDIVDGWYVLPQVERQSFISSINGPRPLVLLPWELAAAITTESFFGVVLMLAALFWGKALVSYAILRQLRITGPALALLIAILFILYPADSGNFLMRALGRHTGVFFYFLAVLFLILAARHSNPLFVAGMVLMEAVSAFIAEQGFLLILVTPLILLLVPQLSRTKRIVILLCWYSVLAAAVGSYLLAEKPGQERLFAAGLVSNPLAYLREIVLSNLVAIRRVFFDGWFKALNALQEFRRLYALLALAVTAVVGSGALLLSRLGRQEDGRGDLIRYLPWLFLAGLALVGLSFFPYSLTGDRYMTSRVFYFAAAGGALVTGAIFSVLVGLLPRWQKPASAMLWGITLFLISYQGFSQHARFVRISEQQQHILMTVVEQVPQPRPGTTIVLVSEAPVFTRVNLVWQSALGWLYQRTDVRGHLCVAPDLCTIPFRTAVIFEYSEQNGARLLDKLPTKLRKLPGARSYAPYRRIGYVPFPSRPMAALELAPDAAHLAPRKWSGEGQTLSDRRVCNLGYSSRCSLLYYNDGRPTAFFQQVHLAGGAGEAFKLSLRGRAAPALKTTMALATVVVVYGDGTTEPFELSAQLNEKWTLQRVSFLTSRPYSSLLVELNPNTTAGLVWLDRVHLSRDGAAVPLPNASFEE